MYIVVHFEDDDSVEAVPSIWYKNGYCIWPKNEQNINSLIEKNSNPNTFKHTSLKAKRMSGKSCKYSVYLYFNI